MKWTILTGLMVFLVLGCAKSADKSDSQADGDGASDSENTDTSKYSRR